MDQSELSVCVHEQSVLCTLNQEFMYTNRVFWCHSNESKFVSRPGTRICQIYRIIPTQK